MIEWVARPLLIILPALIGGMLHSLSIRLNVVPSLKVPVSTRLFGRHKTWRGFTLMPLLCVIGIYAAVLIERQLPPAYAVGFATLTVRTIWLGGLSLGLAYMLFELPNSYLKRRAGIGEGELGTGSRRWLFFLADQADSAVGCLLVCWFFLDVSVTLLVVTFLIGIPLHALTSFGLYLGGIRRQPI